MRTLRPNERTTLLTQYLDGTISDEDRRTLEELLARDADARRELAELRALTGLLGGVQRLEPDIGFWTRLSVRIQEEEQERRSLLPFPRRMLPAVVSATTVVLAVVGVLVMQNRMSVLDFFSKQSKAVKDVVEQSVMKGSILPLFAGVDKDRALQFSLFGELQLDSQSQTALRVDQNAEAGYRIEVGKQMRKKQAPVTFDRFMKEVDPTPDQRRVIDSLLRFAQDRIASAVFVGENNALAIDPNLPHLNRVMVTGIASCLEPPQRVKLERLLADHEAPYAVSMRHAEPALPAKEVYSRLERIAHAERFMVVTPDTAIFLQMPTDFDSLRRQMEMDMQRFEEQRRILFQRLESGEFRRVMRQQVPVPPREGGAGDEFLRIEIGPGPENLPAELHVMVAPRLRRAPMGQGIQEGEVHIRVYQGPQGSVIIQDSVPRRSASGDTIVERPARPTMKRPAQPTRPEPLD